MAGGEKRDETRRGDRLSVSRARKGELDDERYRCGKVASRFIGIVEEFAKMLDCSQRSN